jgi:aspartyl protease family protein
MQAMRLGTIMYVLAIFIFIALMTLAFSNKLKLAYKPDTSLLSSTIDGVRQVQLIKDTSGHYIGTGFINGYPGEFIIDTGATDVAISAEMAKKAGVTPKAIVKIHTANGETRGWSALLDSIEIGGIVEQRVRATIVPSLSNMEVLIGMSFLERLDFTQEKNTLTLKKRL